MREPDFRRQPADSGRGPRAVLLAAGVGRRLGGDEPHRPKALLEFAGKSLLHRHLELLSRFGVAEVSIVVGYEAAAIAEAVRGSPARIAVDLIHNERFTKGSMVSLWTARDVLTSATASVLLMDADVLYDYRMLAALLAAPPRNCLLVDRDFAPGEEPVKVCVSAGRIVDFSKQPTAAHDWHGESVGFFRFSPAAARAVAARSALYVESGREDAEYEDAIRELMLEDALDERLGFADVTGLPWTEIDFPEDVVHAERNILPRLEG